jgi:hypothetical protein
LRFGPEFQEPKMRYQSKQNATPPTADREIFDTNGAAFVLNRHPQTLVDWRADGIGPAWHQPHPNGAIYYLKSDLLAWLASGRREPAKAAEGAVMP